MRRLPRFLLLHAAPLDHGLRLFGQFGDDRIAPTAAMLDRKLEALVAAAFE